jgi:hypothetical protein
MTPFVGSSLARGTSFRAGFGVTSPPVVPSEKRDIGATERKGMRALVGLAGGSSMVSHGSGRANRRGGGAGGGLKLTSQGHGGRCP